MTPLLRILEQVVEGQREAQREARRVRFAPSVQVCELNTGRSFWVYHYFSLAQLIVEAANQFNINAETPRVYHLPGDATSNLAQRTVVRNEEEWEAFY